MTMSETTKEMQKDFWKRSRQPRNCLEKWRKRCNIWISVGLPELANEAGFNVTLEDLLGDSKTVPRYTTLM